MGFDGLIGGWMHEGVEGWREGGPDGPTDGSTKENATEKKMFL